MPYAICFRRLRRHTLRHAMPPARCQRAVLQGIRAARSARVTISAPCLLIIDADIDARPAAYAPARLRRML